MTEKIMINNVDVSGCEQHCSDNRNNPNMCYQDMTGGYLMCQPKERQCNFYVTQIEQQLALKTEECEKLKYWLNRIRDEELSSLDIDKDEYELSCREADYSNIITYVERALGEIDE